MKRSLYWSSVGIQNTVPPKDIEFDKGRIGLEVAKNVAINKAGRIVSFPKPRKMIEGKWHSLFMFRDGIFFGVQDRIDDSALYVIQRINSEVVTVGIRSGLTKGAKMSYAFHGHSTVLYTNGHENGRIVEGDA